MMFGIPGAALAMIRSTKSSRRKAVIGILGSSAQAVIGLKVQEVADALRDKIKAEQ